MTTNPTEGADPAPDRDEVKTEPLLRVERLYKFYAVGGVEVPVLKEIDLTVERGGFTVIMGPSGSGKSTFLHIAAGLEKPSGGTVVLDGRRLFELSEGERTRLRRDRVGFVFQFYNLVPNLTVEQNIRLPLFLRGATEDREDFENLVRFFRLEEKLGHRPYQLSGGEMQRTSIARALMGRPAVVMADEPTGNISSKAGEEVMNLLRRSCDEMGQTILLVTHNARDAAFGDRVRFLKDGELSRDVRLEGEAVNESNIFACLQKLDI